MSKNVMGILSVDKIYTTISVVDKENEDMVMWSKTFENMGVSSMSPFFDSDINNICRQLEASFPKPRFEIEISTMKD
jgi:hypothetical protein